MSNSVSILCITRNRKDLLLRCLKSCYEQDYPEVELVVVDNNSSDGTAEAVSQEFPDAHLVCMRRNFGAFPAHNVAIANATGDYLMTIDDDAYFLQEDALTRMVRAFQEEPELGVVTCNIEGPNEEPPIAEDQYVHGYKAGFAMYPRVAIDEWVGPYPELFFRSGGEEYMSTALWDQGHPIKQLADVWMYHDQALKGRNVRDWNFHGLRSQILCSVMRDPLPVLPARLASKFAKSAQFYGKRGKLDIWTHAWLSALKHLPEAIALRQPISLETRRLLQHLKKTPVTQLDNLPV